jgi:hypothetical protein
MSKIEEAVVVVGYDVNSFNFEIDKFISMGYQPQGGVTVATASDEDVIYSVLMVRTKQ